VLNFTTTTSNLSGITSKFDIVSIFVISIDKGKIVPVLNKASRHEDVLGKWRYSSTHFLTLALDGGEWSA